MIRTRSLALILFALSFCYGCTETVVTQEPLPKGTMVGSATLYQIAKPVLDHSGIKVTLEETGVSTLTDKYGEFRFEDLPTRTYTIRYEKDGFIRL